MNSSRSNWYRRVLLSSVGGWLLETAAFLHRERYPRSAQVFWRGYHVGFSIGVVAALLGLLVAGWL